MRMTSIGAVPHVEAPLDESPRDLESTQLAQRESLAATLVSNLQPALNPKLARARYRALAGGLRRPWRQLERHCPDFRVIRRFHSGTSYLGIGTVCPG